MPFDFSNGVCYVCPLDKRLSRGLKSALVKGDSWQPFNLKTLGWGGQLVVNWVIRDSLNSLQLLGIFLTWGC